MTLLGLAGRAAIEAAGYLRSLATPSDPATWSAKGHSDFVTEADRRSEEIIRDIVLEAEPGSRVVGEELSPELLASGLVWIVDPVDGTTNFVHGFPFFAVSIAAAVDGVVQAGVVLHVSADRLYGAARGVGAWMGPADRPITGSDEPRLRVSTIGEPRHALIGTGFPFKQLHQLDRYQRQFAAVTRAVSGIRRPGSAALDLAWVASGAFDGFWELMLAPWDIAAGLLLIREAGGRVTDLEGRDVEAAHSAVVAGNPAIHGWLLETLGRA